VARLLLVQAAAVLEYVAKELMALVALLLFWRNRSVGVADQAVLAGVNKTVLAAIMAVVADGLITVPVAVMAAMAQFVSSGLFPVFAALHPSLQQT
jgi:hypothetical protein